MTSSNTTTTVISKDGDLWLKIAAFGILILASVLIDREINGH